jgi:hypothetical protein
MPSENRQSKIAKAVRPFPDGLKAADIERHDRATPRRQIPPCWRTSGRLAQGLYDYPRVHKKLGILAPNPDDVAAVLAASALALTNFGR